MIRRIAGAAAVALAVLAAGCGSKSATGVSVPVNGEWSGATSTSTGSIGFDMTLAEDSTEHISGNGLATGLNGSGGSLAYSVSGVRSGSSVTLELNATGLTSPTYSGRLADDNTIEGQLNGSGFSGVALTLRR